MKFTLDLTDNLKTRSDELQKFLDGLTRIKNKGRWDGVYEISIFSIDELLKILDFDNLVIRKQYDFEDDDLIKSHPCHIEIYNSWRE
jgi:hypothetical protein